MYIKYQYLYVLSIGAQNMRVFSILVLDLAELDELD